MVQAMERMGTDYLYTNPFSSLLLLFLLVDGGWHHLHLSLSFPPSFFPFFLTTLTLTLSLTLCGISLQFRLLYLRKVNPSRVHLTTDLLIDGSGASQVLTDLPPSVNLTQPDHTMLCHTVL